MVKDGGDVLRVGFLCGLWDGVLEVWGDEVLVVVRL